jgi:hypothetical protein
VGRTILSSASAAGAFSEKGQTTPHDDRRNRLSHQEIVAAREEIKICGFKEDLLKRAGLILY